MFFGMIIATVFGVFLIPGLFVMMQTFREKLKAAISGRIYDDEDDEDYEDYEDED